MFVLPASPSGGPGCVAMTHDVRLPAQQRPSREEEEVCVGVGLVVGCVCWRDVFVLGGGAGGWGLGVRGAGKPGGPAQFRAKFPSTIT